MCYPKPGPRCAAHLRQQITRLQARREQMLDRFATGQEPGDVNRVTRALARAEEEYAETATARAAAATEIAAMPECPGKTQAQAALDAATARYQAKVDAFRKAQPTGPRELLTAEEEAALGVDIAAGTAARDMLAMTDTDRATHLATLPTEIRARVTDPTTGTLVSADQIDYLITRRNQARNHLVEANLGLLHATVNRFTVEGRRTYLVDRAELQSAAQFELIRAAERWNPVGTARFSSYAIKCMRGAMLSACDNNTDTLARIPANLVTAWKQTRAMATDARVNTRPFRTEDAAAATGQDPATTHTLLNVPLRSWASDVHTLTDHPTLADPGPAAHDTAATAEMRAHVHDALDYLTEREAGVLSMRYGLTGNEPATFDHIGNTYGITRERARQIEAKAMTNLRTLLAYRGTNPNTDRQILARSLRDYATT